MNTRQAYWIRSGINTARQDAVDNQPWWEDGRYGDCEPQTLRERAYQRTADRFDPSRLAYRNRHFPPVPAYTDQGQGAILADNEGDAEEPYYQATCGSWDCRAPECRPKGI